MLKSRKSYTQDFKLEAVKRLLASGRTQQEVAREIGINTNLLWQWKKQYQRELQQTEPPREAPVKESGSSAEIISLLNKQIAKLKEERDMYFEMVCWYKERLK